MLSLIDGKNSLEHKMLIGCQSYFSSNGRVANRSYPSANSQGPLILERIIHNAGNNTFMYFDDSLAQVGGSIEQNEGISNELGWGTQVDIEGHNAVAGLYVLNERFTSSRVSNACKLRFQVAMLLYIPDYSKLKNMLKMNLKC